MQRGRTANRSTRNLRATRGGAPGGMARQMEMLGIRVPEGPGAPSILPAVPTPSNLPGVPTPSNLPEVPSKPKRGLIRIVSAEELAQGSLQTTVGALSLSASTSVSTSSSKGENSMLCPTSERRSSPDRPINDTLRTKDPGPAKSIPTPVEVSSVKELFDRLFAEHLADIASMTISMVLKDGSTLVINASV